MTSRRNNSALLVSFLLLCQGFQTSVSKPESKQVAQNDIEPRWSFMSAFTFMKSLANEVLEYLGIDVGNLTFETFDSPFVLASNGQASWIINVDNKTQCSSDIGPVPFPNEGINYTTGGILSKIPTICGGYYSSTFYDQCYQLIGGKWKQTIKMKTARSSAASVVVGDRLIISGGWNGGKLSSSEIITKIVMKGQDMKQAMFGHCMAFLKNEIYVLGGDRNGASKATYKHDFNFNYVSEAPGLKEHRVYFVCNAFQDKIIVAGGFEKTSAEVYDPQSNSWSLFENLPSIGWGAAMVPMNDSFAIFHSQKAWRLTYINGECKIEEFMETVTVNHSIIPYYPLPADHEAVNNCTFYLS